MSVAFRSDAFDGHWTDKSDGWGIEGDGEVHWPGIRADEKMGLANPGAEFKEAR